MAASHQGRAPHQPQQPPTDSQLQDRLERWHARLQSLPSIALPTDYPRPATSQVVQSLASHHLSARTRTALVRLAVHRDEGEAPESDADDSDADDDDGDNDAARKRAANPTPTPFHLLLAAFAVLLHRYTGDTDLVIGSSSSSGTPLVLRIPIEPGDPFWQIVRRIQAVEREADADAAPYEDIVQRLERDKPQPSAASGAADAAPPSAPLFRVRFFDETAQPHMRRDFLQSTSLTTDLTLFVTRPGAGPSDPFATPLPTNVDSSAAASTQPSDPSTTTSASFRSSVVPDMTLHVSYNALLFSAARTKLLLAHLSHALVAAAANPAVSVGSIPLRTHAEDAVLPDPRKDLDFCGWMGSITSIFERNAAAHPQRRCLVESLSTDAAASDVVPASRTREVTYAELDRASNVLAHHLLRNGLQSEEVVTVYAHRGVDLVVAVLGTLKAGGTFNVIDPAYPASRQIIYLQVARPRALVVLAKAGTLSPTVRKCIREELELRVEVPALELLEHGEVRGGRFSGGGDNDVLADAQPLAGKTTGVELGPDSIGTLSFTSGSTGIPKGVRGRHHSLTHFFPWMGERFGIGEHSRFTMLSGIAHDPIQRDIFTPLFFGAELHIPTAEDIGTPGRLAEWMDNSRVTITHLTPAMGQLLSAQATRKIPSLRNAFFVGDVLTKRDCTRLQALANNVRIINMYGTTETQRAVSYFAIPPVAERPTFLATQKDIMPAGQGMKDVQLLVVNRHERTATCAVGEVGEIYVRSGGLSEGYLGPPEVTAEKFVANFLAPDCAFVDTLGDSAPAAARYWKGVRDRMYKTGDLGRYLPDGTVECTGRADDQVKIRGFRIELGEIDTHLSRHPHVRENVTLVRRDKDEEKVLVSYFVPGAGAAELEELSGVEHDGGGEATTTTTPASLAKGMRRHRRLIRDLRDHLKKKLPAYSVPTLFVPLAKMPLNPNGKIDKPALPFPDTALLSAEPTPKAAAAAVTAADDGSSGKAGGFSQGGSNPGAGVGATRHATPTESTIASLFAELLPSAPRPIPLDESFFDLGGHSILATRLVFGMRKSLVASVPLGLVFDHPSVEALAREVERLRDADLHLGAAAATPSAADGAVAAAQQPPGAGASAAGATSAAAGTKASMAPESEYAADVEALARTLPDAFVGGGALSNLGSAASSTTTSARARITVLLTGATGFLGAFVLRDLLERRASRVARVVAHVRARDEASAMARLREGGEARGVWDEAWVRDGRVSVVVGDLARPRLGVSPSDWVRLASEVDAVVHNGALVHWVYPYAKLRSANVLSTLACIHLCGAGRPKTLTFVSSTSALDTDHYVRLSDSLVAKRNSPTAAASTDGVGGEAALAGVPEMDDLAGSARGLKTGYGQSKWAAEKLVMTCASRGLRACIVRPGYVVGDSERGVTNTDDFLWRLVKGSAQLGLLPDMHNAVNMVPVDHVARITSLAALAAEDGQEGGAVAAAAAHRGGEANVAGCKVYHVMAHPTLRFVDLLGALPRYGWKVQKAEYVVWRTRLEEHVLATNTPASEAGGRKDGGDDAANEESNALFPLLHFVLDDLPTSTKAPELDDRHTQALLAAAREDARHGVATGVTESLVARYLAWLVQARFLAPPQVAPGQEMVVVSGGGGGGTANGSQTAATAHDETDVTTNGLVHDEETVKVLALPKMDAAAAAARALGRASAN